MNPDFPVFVLCGVLLSETNYQRVVDDVESLKSHFWGNNNVILHSRDIRKCNNEFSILFDIEVKKNFYERLNTIMTVNDYGIIASAILKEKYIKRYGRLSSDVYEVALSFIIERSVFYLDHLPNGDKELDIIIEKRGKREDKQLNEHFQKLQARGTGFVSATRLKKYKFHIMFKSKADNLAGLQIADLLAYPIARYVIDGERANPAFDLIENKIYTNNGKRYGLKIFP